MNYYKAHPNKKPKRIPRRKLNPKRAHTAIIMAMNCLQVSTIQSNIFKNPALKSLEVANVVISTAQQIQNLFSAKQKYLDRYHDKKNIRLLGRKTFKKSFGKK